jgi:small subunit ribosomal protein S16
MAAVVIRLKRLGAKKDPHSRIIVIPKHKARGGRAIEELGFYNPAVNPPKVKINMERAKFWMERGAVPSPTVKRLIQKSSKVS